MRLLPVGRSGNVQTRFIPSMDGRGPSERGLSFGFVSNDFFGFRHDKNCLSFMLLRSPVQRGFKLNENFELSGASDLGVHEFSWVMIPQCELVADVMHRELSEIQQPPVCFDRYEGMNRPPVGEFNSLPFAGS